MSLESLKLEIENELHEIENAGHALGTTVLAGVLKKMFSYFHAGVAYAAPVEVAPVEVAPVEVAPVEVAPVEVAPAEVAPAEVAPVEGTHAV